MSNISPSHWDRSRALNLVDIRGWKAISYLRFSSSLQEGNDSIARQRAALDHAVREVGLELDRSLEDHAKSASKGHHRTKGELGLLLFAITEGAVPQGTILIVENIDRLTREGVLDAYTMLATIIHAGVVLLVCGDEELELYDEAAINGRAGDRLHSDIRAAYKYTKRLAQFQRSQQKRRREQALRGEKVIPNGIVPGWLDRDLNTRTHHLNQHAGTIERIFRECVKGASARQIAAGLNRDGVLTMQGAAVWRAPRIGAILRDDAVIGYWTPTQLQGKTRVPAGPPAPIYPPAVGHGLWQEVQNALSARRGITRGAIGTTVPNLFTGHVFCGSCGGTLRIDTGGGLRGGRRKRHFLCGAYMDAKTCAVSVRYDLDVLERRLVWKLARMIRLVPKTARTMNAHAEQIAGLRIGIEQQEAMVLGYMRNSSPTVQTAVAKLAAETDSMRRRAEALEHEAAVLAAERTAAEEFWPVLRATIAPALRGEVEARDRLRGLLSRHAYRIVGDKDDLGGLIIHAGTAQSCIHPDDDARERSSEA